MEHRILGKNGPSVSALGLGCMAMSDAYGPSDRTESLATLHAALEKGITLLDTGDFYGMGHNELLLAEALKGKREKAFIQVKFGAQRSPDGAFIGFDTRPAALKTALAYTLKRLGTDYIDLYQPARLDPSVPIEETIGAIAELVQAGYVRHIGVSELGVENLRKAHATHPLAQLQIEYSLLDRNIEDRILPACRELGISITAYGVLARGLMGGSKLKGEKDFRGMSPRFQGDNLSHNRSLAQALADAASSLGLSAAQAAIAWVASQGPDIVPLVGARTVRHLEDAVAAPLSLSPSGLAAIEAAVPKGSAKGDRYPEQQMHMLDSERT